MLFLKQSTAVTVKIGPFVDETDGFTAEGGLTLTQADIRLSMNGGNFAQKTEANNATIDEIGYYDCPIDATDTGTLGRLVLAVHESGARPVRHEYMVIPANEYDSLISGTDALDVNVAEVSEDSTAADNLELACDNYSATRGLSGTALPAAAADAAGGLPISDAGGLDLDLYIKSSVTLSGTAAAGDTVVKITLTGGVATNNYYNGQLVIITGGTGVGQARTILKYLAAGTAATPTRDFTVAPDDTSTFVVIGADVPSILEAGIAQAGAAATITLDSTASATNDIYKNNFLMISGGTGAGQTRLIGAYDGGTKIATILPNWTTNPDATSIYQVLPMARVDIQGWLGNVVTGDGDWAALNNISAADVNAQVVDVLKTDTIAEMAQGIPPTTPTFEEAVMYLYMALRNKGDVTATLKEFHNDAGTVICKKTLSYDGTTYSEAKAASGP